MITLHDHQVPIVDKLKKNKSNFLAADIGTGKTIMTLKAAQSYTKVKKLLIISPLCVVSQWCKAIIENTAYTQFKVINYDKLIIKKHFDIINEFVDKNTLIVLDEAHRIKSIARTKTKGYKTKRVQAIMSLKDKTEYKMCLTGTPQNREYIDYMNGLIFLDKLPITLDQFEDNFCKYKYIDCGGPFPIKTLSGYRNKELLTDFLSECVIYHKLDKAYKPIEEVINVPKTPLFNKIKKAASYDDEILTSPKRRYLLDICTAEEKAKVIKDMLQDIEERVVIFYKYDAELEVLKELADDLKIPYSEYNGHKKDLTNFDKYEKSVCFNNYGSGAEGTNAFIKSHIMIIMQYTDYSTFLQAKGRIDRIGQTKTPVYYYLVTDGTNEKDKLEALKKGQNYDNRMYDNYITYGK